MAKAINTPKNLNEFYDWAYNTGLAELNQLGKDKKYELIVRRYNAPSMTITEFYADRIKNGILYADLACTQPIHGITAAIIAQWAMAVEDAYEEWQDQCVYNNDELTELFNELEDKIDEESNATDWQEWEDY